MLNTSGQDYIIEKGHKIAQVLIQKIEQPKIEEVNELSDSSRGKMGHGSTGK
jgi:dUTP pyrophosphatase